MNCSNCAAPLSPVKGRGYFRCDFCATLHFPRALHESADRVVPLGEAGILDCPLCESRLAAAAIDGQAAQLCQTCRGVLLDNETFSDVMRCRRQEYDGGQAVPELLDPADLRRRTLCPHCRGRMDTFPYYGPGNVVVDSCPRCRLIWFDHGELAAIERAPGKRW